MIRRFLASGIVSLAVSLSASAQNPNSEQLQALKEGLTPEQQQALLQGTLGDGTGKKTDRKLSTPNTVQPKPPKTPQTVDGRVLRQSGEDPELRPNDELLVELKSVDEVCSRLNLGPNPENKNLGSNGNNTSSADSLNALNSLNGSSALNASAAGDALGNRNSAAIGRSTNGDFDLSRCPASTDAPKADAEKSATDMLLKRIARNNPYTLNRFGVLELPGLPAIPLAGLTAAEATRRLQADPGLDDFYVRLMLLRLVPSGEAALKPFGYDLFEGVPSTFAPVSDIQVPIDYIVGPGDTLDIQLYGGDAARYELTVERDGRVNFPKLGPIMVSGLSFNQARETIEQRVAKQLIGTRVSVTMGDLRSIRVFVLGEAEKPGSYTVSGLSTMTNALFVSGGVKKIGSLRNIELKRNGHLVTTLDLYDLLLHGDTSADRQLMAGDVIFIPPIGKTVSVDGAVKRPAIYELKSEKTVVQAVDIAGGLLPDADEKTGQLERILPSSLRQMRNIDLTLPQGRDTELANGDKLDIPAIRPTLENSVKLSGYVYRPGKFEYRTGLRLSDILSFNELRPNADVHYIMIRREIPPEERVEVVSADLKRALAARGSSADPELRPRDEIIVFNLSSNRDRILEPILRDLELQASPDAPEQIVSIDGKVKAPGRYPLEPAMHVSDLIRAGGSLEDAAYRGQAELTRYQIVDGDARRTELIPVNLAAIWRGDPAADLALQPFDVLVIKPISMWVEPGSIELKGEMRFPGLYPIHQGETLYGVLQRAGGLTSAAFPEGAVLIREDLKTREHEQLELLANRLQGDLAALSLEVVASSAASPAANGAANASQSLIIGQQLLGQLRDTKPVGRLVINIGRVLKGPSGIPGDVLLRDGDKLLIPKRSQEVTILGEVQSPTSHVFEASLTRDDYIAKSGGTTQKADRKRIYVVRANGDVISGQRSGWFRRTQSIEIRPGDTIVVPLDTERVRALPIWQAVTTIIYNLAVALLAVNSVK